MPPDFEKMPISEIAKFTGIKASTLSSRLAEGMSKTEAATRPLKNTSGHVRKSKEVEKAVSDDLALSKAWLVRALR